MRISKDEAIKRLTEDYDVRPGSTIYVIQRTVARSGMSRTLSLFVKGDDGNLYAITHLVAAVFGQGTVEANGALAIRVSGGGMDMNFHTVYSLSWALFGNGCALKHRTL